MNLQSRSLVAAVLLFTAFAVAMLWVLTQRWQGELLEQVMTRAEKRSLQLAGAMAGQEAAELALMDHTLLDLRSALQIDSGLSRDPIAFGSLASQRLEALPKGLVSYLSMIDAEGRVVFSSMGSGIGVDLSDRTHFQAHQAGGDQLVVGAPLVSRLNGQWLISVGRPLMRDGRFDGSLHLLVSSEFLAQRLGSMALAEDDAVALIHPSGRFLAHSANNLGAMGQTFPGNRPFFAKDSGDAGTFKLDGLVDAVPRVFGWQRLPGSGLVVAVGLSEASVLAPLGLTLRRSYWLTAMLSLMLLAGGFGVAWLLWRIDQGTRALSESEQLLKGAQRMAKVGHWILDHRTGDLFWSDEVYRIFGKRRGIDQPSYEGFLDQVHPDDYDRVKAAYRSALKSGDSMEEVHRIVMPDGSEKHLRELCVFKRINSRLVQTHGTVQDITEVRVAQQALEHMNSELEERVALRTRELGALNNELEAFAYSVSHDLRTPLRSIHGFASLLEEESETLSPEGRTHLRRIQDGARRMGLLITDLLTMAHHSRAVVNLQLVNLSELAQSVAADFARSDTARVVQWTIDEGLFAMADPVLLRVVLQNLMGNAWKYTGQTAQPQVAFSQVGESGGMLEFCIRDNGAGFDMAYVRQLFQPFKRLHAHHEFEGTGVGLASVHRLIQRHGGTVRAEGAIGKGAAFYFTLPKVSTFAEPIESGER